MHSSEECQQSSCEQGGCCGGQNAGPARILSSYNATACAALCCADPMCGVAVLEKDNGGQIKCWLTHLNLPDGITPMPGGAQESVVILTRNTTTVPVDERTGGLIFGEGGWQSLQGSPVGSHFFVENIRELLDSESEWYFDSTSDSLYHWRNSSYEAEHPDAVFVGSGRSTSLASSEEPGTHQAVN